MFGDDDDERDCEHCGARDWTVNDDSFSVCRQCGRCDSDCPALVSGPTSHATDRGGWNSADTGELTRVFPRRGTRIIPGTTIRASPSGQSRGRYKPKFRYMERLAQWSLSDPDIPEADRRRIDEESKNPKYGAVEEYGRATIYLILRELGLEKYRERWKQLLVQIKKMAGIQASFTVPSSHLMTYLEETFDMLQAHLLTEKNVLPKSHLKRGGKKVTCDRHNYPHFNYIQRKQLEAIGNYDFHEDLPQLRSVSKLHALDDMMEPLARKLNMKFHRSTVIKRPKFKRVF